MWVYISGSGSLYDGKMNPPFLVAMGYSGVGMGLNNPDIDFESGIGPICDGTYIIEAPVHSDKLGAYVLPLVPDPSTETHGRSGFCIHGDSIHAAGEHAASRGCVILPRQIREKLWESGDHVLKVEKTYDISPIYNPVNNPVHFPDSLRES